MSSFSFFLRVECTLSEYKVDDSQVLELLDKVSISKREVELVSALEEW